MLGDCAQTLKEIPDNSVQCCVTSPPYFGLRDYGHDDQIGLEKTPEEFIAKLVNVFREVRRVLKDDGVLWVNIGDSYAGSWGNYGGKNRGKGGQREIISGSIENDVEHKQPSTIRPASSYLSEDLKAKDLIGIHWMLAFALRADGWYLRQDIIWNKPNPMPESVKDRCTKAHEYIFLLSKSQKYFFDAEAISEPITDAAAIRLLQNIAEQEGSSRVPGKTNGNMKAVVRKDFDSSMGGGGTTFVGHSGYRKADGTLIVKPTRNRRSVWTVTTKPYKGAHFATFPPELIEPCILAGSKPGDTILDPFGGSGTTAGVAIKHGRKTILCELNSDYRHLMVERIEKICGKKVDTYNYYNDNDEEDELC